MKNHSLPLQLWELDDKGFHAVVCASLQGKPILLLIDTGANHSCFDTHFFTNLIGNDSIKGSDEHNVGIGGDDFETVIATISNLKIARVTIPPMEIRLLDLSKVNDMYKMVGFSPIQGILGGDFFKKYRAIINYDNNTLCFSK